MLDDINDRLLQTKEQLRRKRKLDSMLRQSRQSLSEQNQRKASLEAVLAKEKMDVNNLEGFSLTGLFYSILGTKVERLQKEKQECLAAKLKLEECAEAVEEVQTEVSRLETELASYADTETTYERILREKDALLSNAGNAQAEYLLRLSERLGELTAQRRELSEAVAAGDAALRDLEKVHSALQSAANWGTWDMLGGGFFATMAKHGKIDEAKQHAKTAQRSLRRFQEELADAGERLHVSIDVSGFAKFADFFFDGLITDWVVQSKIQNASSACVSTISQAAAAHNQCREQLRHTEQEAEEVARIRREIVEQA